MNTIIPTSYKTTSGREHLLAPGSAFMKYHSLGNDFIIVNLLDDYTGEITSLVNYQDLIPRIQHLCNRSYGIGANGILLLTRSTQENSIHATIFNQDGSIGSLCLNGARCITHYLAHYTTFPSTTTIIMGESHLKGSYDDKTSLITTTLPLNSFEKPEIVPITSLTYGYSVNLGNPHLVIFQSITEEGLILFAKNLTSHKLFEKGVNIEYVWQTPAQHKSTHYTMRIYERGVGITQACGSGVCAALYTLNHLEHIHEHTPVYFDMPGGTLQASIDLTTHTISLVAEAHDLFSGVLFA